MQDIVLGVAFLSVITDTPSTGATIKQFLNTQEQNNKIKPEWLRLPSYKGAGGGGMGWGAID